jgi:hypothetical protein
VFSDEVAQQASGLAINALSRNEARSALGLSPVEGGGPRDDDECTECDGSGLVSRLRRCGTDTWRPCPVCSAAECLNHACDQGWDRVTEQDCTERDCPWRT